MPKKLYLTSIILLYFCVPVWANNSLLANYGSITQTAGGACFLPILGQIQRLFTESLAQTVFRSAGTLSHLSVYVTANTLTNSSTLISRKNAGNGNLSISIGAGATGTFSDLSHSDSVSAGDKYDLSLTTGSGGTSLILVSSCINYNSTSANVSKYGSEGTNGLSGTAAITKYFSLGGILSKNSTEVQTQHTMRIGGTLQNMQVNIDANTSPSATTFTLRHNTANGNETISVAANTSGIQEDTSDTDTVVSGDLVNFVAVTAANPSITPIYLGVDLAAPSNDFEMVTSNNAASSVANNTTVYNPIGGILANNATEINVNNISELAFTARNLRVYVIANNDPAASIVNFRDGGASKNESVTITASTTGFFEDKTHTDAVAAGDAIDTQLVTGATSGSVTIGEISINGDIPSVTTNAIANSNVF